MRPEGGATLPAHRSGSSRSREALDVHRGEPANRERIMAGRGRALAQKRRIENRNAGERQQDLHGAALHASG